MSRPAIVTGTDRDRDRASSAVFRIEGALLPPDLLTRIALSTDPKTVKDLGLRPADYELTRGVGVRDAAAKAWANLRETWTRFSEIPLNGRGDGATRKNWLLPLFYELGFGNLQAQRSHVRVMLPRGGGQRQYPISHFWEHVPVNLLSWNTDLDQRSGKERHQTSPQSLLQDFLNQEDKALWGVVSNGHCLRLLRDSTALTGSAYIEFDLEAIFEGESYSDFVLLFLMLHRTRFAPEAVEELLEDAEDTDESDGLGPMLLDETEGFGEPAPAEPVVPSAATCWLEKWRQYAFEVGIEARDKMRQGVSDAMVTLGNGFLTMRGSANQALSAAVNENALSALSFRHGLLRLVYRLMFLFIAEDRGVLHAPGVSQERIERYAAYFSTVRLRKLAARRAGDHNTDLWDLVQLVFGALRGKSEDDDADENAARKAELLGLPQLGGLFERTEFDVFEGCKLTNAVLLAAVFSLSTVMDADGRRRPVDYRNLGSDELGSVFEALLEEIPHVSPTMVGTADFTLQRNAGNERKTSGSFYTPTSIIECLLDSALEPVLDQAIAKARGKGDSEYDALLKVTVCDPACGSGHFLTAAARRIAKRRAILHSEDDEPTPARLRHEMHAVVHSCIHGVDINPLAVELTKVALWIEALEPGRPLSFLDAQIKWGNGLIGATPKLLEDGIPDAAFKAIEGDNPQAAIALRARNKREARGRLKSGDKVKQQTPVVSETLFELDQPVLHSNYGLGEKTGAILSAPVRQLSDTVKQRRLYKEYLDAREPDVLLADTWCAAFVQRKQISQEHLTNAAFFNTRADSRTLSAEFRRTTRDLAEDYRFFHWHLEFPHIFRELPLNDNEQPDEVNGWYGGFSAVVGNPPWERVKLQEKEFFASRDAQIAAAKNKAEREALIDALIDDIDGPGARLHAAFMAAKRRADGETHLLRDSGRFPLAGTGDINTYAVFAETAKHAIAPDGRFGLVLPTGIATDKTTSPYFASLTDEDSPRLVSFFEFENEGFVLSRSVHHSFRFCLLTATGSASTDGKAEFAAGIRQVPDLVDRKYEMSPADIRRVNPNTGTLPVFRTQRDADITIGIYERVPVLINESLGEAGNPWGMQFMAMFHMSNDSYRFKQMEALEADGLTLTGNVFSDEQGKQRYLPLYEAKMLHHYDHRYGTYEGQTEKQAKVRTLPRVTPEQHDDPDFAPRPMYWLTEKEVTDRLAQKRWSRQWLHGWRDICRTTDSRTLINSFQPATAVGDKFLLALTERDPALLAAAWSSFVCDYCARQKIGGTSLKYFTIMQIATPSPDMLACVHPFITPRVLELTYTSHDMAPFARDLGDGGPPFLWDEERRFQLRAELDALMFRVYGVAREDVDYIMDTFTTVAARDRKQYNDRYRTKEAILEIYDAMPAADALESIADSYHSPLTPPPGHGARHPTG